MCRWLVLKGSPHLLADVILSPVNALVNQALHAGKQHIAFTPDLPAAASSNYHEANHAVNADGFGVGWYDHDTREEPALFRSTTPAWSNSNLHELARAVRGDTIFAHVRAASPGLPVVETNCHPFKHGNLLWMHNGAIAGWNALRRPVQRALSDEVYDALPRGSTDSEHCFALFLQHLLDSATPAQARAAREKTAAPFSQRREERWTADQMCRAMATTIGHVDELQRGLGLSAEEAASSFNFCATDGHAVVASRCRSGRVGVLADEEPPSLYYGMGADFGVCEASGGFRFGATTRSDARGAEDVCKEGCTLIVSSEPLTQRGEDWSVVPNDVMLVAHESEGGGGVERLETVPIAL